MSTRSVLTEADREVLFRAPLFHGITNEDCRRAADLLSAEVITFSASETAEGTLEVAPEANVVDVEAFEAEEDDEDEDGEGDAIESLDYDEWATVFLADSEARAESDDEADSEAENESFLNYFDEANDDEEEEEDWEDDEEYDDEEEFDDDVDDEAEDFDENDEFDETDDE
jgi:hypothetical protein